MKSRFENYDQYVEAAMRSWHCPGVALSVIREDRVLHQNAYGLRDVEEQQPMTVDTRFAMASVTKSFTAMSVALLVDEGKLEWDKPVRDYIPEFILHDPYVTQHITVRDMLSHRSGLPRHDLAAFRLELSPAEFIKRMRHLRFSTSFREKFQYNNLMYYVTAYLVEAIAGQRWQDFVQERIFALLGMQASNFVPEPPLPGQVNALGYRVDFDHQGKATGLSGMPFGHYTELSPGSAGALFSTLADLTRWLKVHVNEGRIGGVQLVSSHNLKQMHVPQTVVPASGFSEALMGNTIFNYGLGWSIEPYRGYTLVHHGGNLEGHSLIIGFVPQAKVGVVALTNVARLPLRDVLFYTSIDRALGLPDRDWNKQFHTMVDPLVAATEQSKQTAADEQIADAPPTHPLATFVGTYAGDGYPDFAVREGDDGLQACTVGSLDWSTLRHYHYNVFEWHLADFDMWMKVRFLVDDQGEIGSVSIPIEPEVENVTFTRKQLALSGDVIAQVVGIYTSPIEGVEFTVTANRDKVYVAETGTPPEEVTPHRLRDAVVSFRTQRRRYEFMRENQAITRLVVKSQFLTLEAPRRG
jgi:CubicO group peptidase (beta-lactamase class C family)